MLTLKRTTIKNIKSLISVYIPLSDILSSKSASYYLRWGYSKALNNLNSAYKLFSETRIRVKSDLIKTYLIKKAVQIGSVRVYTEKEG